MNAYPFNASADDSGSINANVNKLDCLAFARNDGNKESGSNPPSDTSLTKGVKNSFAKQTETCHAELVSASCNRHDYAIECQARNDGESGKKHKTSPTFLSAQSSLRTAPSPKLGEGRGEVKKAAFTLAKVFHPVRQSRRIAFSLAEVFHPVRQSRKIAFTLAEVFHPVRQSRKIAFTLAEVLITLGIIGVVAALTMPSLIQKHRKHIVETRLAKFYSTINQALNQAEAEYGDKRNWDEYKQIFDEEEHLKPDTNYFNKYIAPYIKANKIENIQADHIAVFFSDGSVATFRSPGIYFWINYKEYERAKKNNLLNDKDLKVGTEVFSFFLNTTENSTNNKFHYGKGVEPYKYNWDGSTYMLLNDNSIGCKKTVWYQRAYCTAYIQMNGWKIPKNYPLKF